MANSDIIRRMLQLVDRHESGSLTSVEVECAFEYHMSALEQIGSREIDASRDLTYRLVEADLSENGDDNFEIEEDTTQVRAEMRNFLQSLPGAKIQ